MDTLYREAFKSAAVFAEGRDVLIDIDDLTFGETAAGLVAIEVPDQSTQAKPVPNPARTHMFGGDHCIRRF